MIGDPTFSLLLVWRSLPMHSDSVKEVKAFLAAAKLRDALNAKEFGAIDGYAGATEYNSVASGIHCPFQPHVHLVHLPGRRSPSAIERKIRKFWLGVGGANVLPREKGDEVGCLAGFFGYVNKHPLNGFEQDISRRLLHRYVLRAVELERAAPAVVRFIGGPALSGWGFRKLRARPQQPPYVQHRGSDHVRGPVHVPTDRGATAEHP